MIGSTYRDHNALRCARGEVGKLVSSQLLAGGKVVSEHSKQSTKRPPNNCAARGARFAKRSCILLFNVSGNSVALTRGSTARTWGALQSSASSAPWPPSPSPLQTHEKQLPNTATRCKEREFAWTSLFVRR